MARKGEAVKCSIGVIVTISTTMLCIVNVRASDLLVDACLAADPNSLEIVQIERVIDLCTSALSGVQVSRSIRADLYKIRGVAHRSHGDLATSLEDLNNAVDLDSGNADHLRMRGWTLREAGRPADAEKDYDRALAIDPEWQGYLSRCVTRVDQRKYALALEDCEKSLARRRLGDGLFFSAFALHRLGRSEEALPRITEACGLDGALSEHFLLLAEVQLKLGQHSRAQETAQKAVEQFPNDRNLRDALSGMGL